MNSKDLKSIAEGLIETFKRAGNESIKIEKQGVKIKTKEDGSPVTNGDLKVNEIITEKIDDSCKIAKSQIICRKNVT